MSSKIIACARERGHRLVNTKFINGNVYIIHAPLTHTRSNSFQDLPHCKRRRPSDQLKTASARILSTVPQDKG